MVRGARKERQGGRRLGSRRWERRAKLFRPSGASQLCKPCFFGLKNPNFDETLVS